MFLMLMVASSFDLLDRRRDAALHNEWPARVVALSSTPEDFPYPESRHDDDPASTF
jgi:hypothetical protein